MTCNASVVPISLKDLAVPCKVFLDFKSFGVTCCCHGMKVTERMRSSGGIENRFSQNLCSRRALHFSSRVIGGDALCFAKDKTVEAPEAEYQRIQKEEFQKVSSPAVSTLGQKRSLQSKPPSMYRTGDICFGHALPRE